MVLTLILLLGYRETHAQDIENPKTRLENAEILYSKGDFREIIEIGNSCLALPKDSLDTDVQWSAYRLLAMAHLGLNQYEEARQYAIQMLELNPAYKPSYLKDPNELVKLLGDVTVIPKFSLGMALSLGPSATLPKVQTPYFVSGNNKTYRGKGGYQASVSSSYSLSKSISCALGLSILTKNYELDYSFDPWELLADEKLSYLSFPLSVTYLPDLRSKVRPYVQMGYYWAFLLNSSNSFQAKHSSGNSFELIDIDSKNRRNQGDRGIQLGLGSYYKLGQGHVFVEMNYYRSGRQITNADSRNSSGELFSSFYYMDDDLLLSNLSICAGYRIHLNYKVIKE
ncbi:MAG: outer membrane beta-barrel protein [Flavobacteriales bacterium]|nr:outer membrane beta-barrel protein [Flavobacteriales bacterium]